MTYICKNHNQRLVSIPMHVVVIALGKNLVEVVADADDLVAGFTAIVVVVVIISDVAVDDDYIVVTAVAVYAEIPKFFHVDVQYLNSNF